MMQRKRRRSSASPDPELKTKEGLSSPTTAASSSKASKLLSSFKAVAALHVSNPADPSKVPKGYIPSPSIIEVPSYLQVRQSKYERRLRRVKKDARSELDVNDWSRFQYSRVNFWIDPSQDKIPRCNYHTCSTEEFIELYEEPAIPVVITGATDDWPAQTEWLPEKLLEHYHGEKFKIGEDDDGDSVYMQFSHFFQYSLSSGDAELDDSPLYIFDSVFGDRTRNYSAKRITKKKKRDEKDKNEEENNSDEEDTPEPSKPLPLIASDEEADGEEDAMDSAAQKSMEKMMNERRKKGKWDSIKPQSLSLLTMKMRGHWMTVDSKLEVPAPSSREKFTITVPMVRKLPQTSSRKPEPFATKELLNDYKVPRYFTDDLFQYTGSKRPPYRWMVIGPARSGTGIHVDPLGTSAWNALVHGHKRWALFSATHVVLPDYEAATWFALVYPTYFDESTRHTDGTLLADRLGLMEIIQRPGETVFVPGGWHHVVINLDFTVAVTQNFCSRTNFEHVWLRTRFSRPGLSKKLIRRFTDFAANPSLHQHPLSPPFATLLERIKFLDTVPACQPSSTSDSSSSDSSESDTAGGTDDATASESSDENGRCMCRKCKIRRKRRVKEEEGGVPTGVVKMVNGDIEEGAMEVVV
ncbi:hypothetical protein BC829DRAFT_430478 [Chytridium lagenaria]|nr:hypothetical protein BC829DRAFT_430478 [Chytridium lagenaria]